MSIRSLALLTLLVSLPPLAFAVDGVVEINQAAALAGGVTPGDDPGFPVTISESGSYRLTSNLDVTAAPLPGVSVLAPDVTIDLNGFAMFGPQVCTGNPPEEDLICPDRNSVFDGISSNRAGLTVQNGSIRAFPGDGIDCRDCSVIDVTAEGNGWIGVRVIGNGGFIRGSVARRNGLAGLGGNVSIESSAAVENGGDGILVDQGANLVQSCRAVRNHSHGIRVLEGTVVSESVVLGNGGPGIALGRSAAFDNVVRGNGEGGIAVFSPDGSPGVGSSYGQNTIDDNDVSTVTVLTGGLAIELGLNLCETNTTCP